MSTTTRTYAEAARLARELRIRLNKQRKPRPYRQIKQGYPRFHYSYFNGVDIAAKPAVFERSHDGGSTFCIQSFEYDDDTD
jgi:hypothetical protein